MRILLILATITFCAPSNAQTLQFEKIATLSGVGRVYAPYLRSSPFGLTATTAIKNQIKGSIVLMITETGVDTIVFDNKVVWQTVVGDGVLYFAQTLQDSALASMDLQTGRIDNIFTGENTRLGFSLVLTQNYIAFHEQRRGPVTVNLRTGETTAIMPNWNSQIGGYFETFVCSDTAYVFYENIFNRWRVGEPEDRTDAYGKSPHVATTLRSDSVCWVSHDGYYYSHSVANGGTSKRPILSHWPITYDRRIAGDHGVLAYNYSVNGIDTEFDGFVYIDFNGNVQGSIADSAISLVPDEPLQWKSFAWYDGWFYGVYLEHDTTLALVRIKEPDQITSVEEESSTASTRTSIQYISNQQLCDMLNEREEETQVFDVRGERIIDCSSARGLVALKRSNGYELFFTVP